MPRRTDKHAMKRIARERIAHLFSQADGIFAADRQLANRYVQLARKLAMKARVRIPRELKRKFCRHCDTYLRPGANTRIRIAKSRVIILCLACKRFTRIPVR